MDHGQIASWVDADIEVIASGNLAFEAISVIRNQVQRGLITAEAGRQAFDVLVCTGDQSCTRYGTECANLGTGKTVSAPTAYNTYYMALAEALGCELWTADRRLVNAVGQSLDWVKWSGGVQSEPPTGP